MNSALKNLFSCLIGERDAAAASRRPRQLCWPTSHLIMLPARIEYDRMAAQVLRPLGAFCTAECAANALSNGIFGSSCRSALCRRPRTATVYCSQVELAPCRFMRSFPNIAGTDGTNDLVQFHWKAPGSGGDIVEQISILVVPMLAYSIRRILPVPTRRLGNASGASSQHLGNSFRHAVASGSIQPTTNPAVTYGGGDAVWAVLRIDHHGANPDVSGAALPAADKDDAYLFINPDPSVEPATRHQRMQLSCKASTRTHLTIPNLDFLRPFVGKAPMVRNLTVNCSLMKFVSGRITNR